MELSANILQELGGFAKQAAKLAGEYIATYLNKTVKIENKIGGDSFASQVVTEVDIKSQELILQFLKPTFVKYDLALLTEESVDDKSRFEKDFFWCIDPLDGTLPFTEKTSGFAVSIALVSKFGVPYIGVIYDPFTKTLYSAIKAQGAFKNEKPWNISYNKKLFHFICDRSFKKHTNYHKLISDISKLVAESSVNDFKIISHGGAAMNAIWVLENAPACYIKLPKKYDGGGSLWDYAATTCIFNETNATATNVYGKALDLNRKDSTFMNHEGVCFSSIFDLGLLTVINKYLL